MSEYQDYGFTDKPAHSHSYLYDVLVSLVDNKKKNILDVGCGNGAISIRLLNQGYNIYGIDASVTGIELARKSYPDRFYLQDINSGELPKELKNINFNTIISTEVIEHLYNPRIYIKFCKQVLMKNGGGN